MRRPPAPLIVLGGAAFAFLALPLAGLFFRVPWSSLGEAIGSRVVVDALRVSLTSSVAAVGVALLIGVPLAWTLARVDFPGKGLVRGVVILPMVLPPVVSGAALLFALGRRGLVGSVLHDATGLVLPFSIWGVIAAVTFVSMPFLVVTVEAALRSMDGRLEDAASSLGAGRWKVLRTVTLPAIAPSLAAGMALTWARAFGEFGATITFAGNLQGRTQSLPLAVFVALEQDRGTAIAISVVMVVVSVAVIVVLRDRWWRGS